MAVVREVLKDIDMISNGSIAGVEPCDNPVENCLFCKDFFLCAYKRYAESFPPGEVEDFLYCPDLERVENEPHH